MKRLIMFLILCTEFLQAQVVVPWNYNYKATAVMGYMTKGARGQDTVIAVTPDHPIPMTLTNLEDFSFLVNNNKGDNQDWVLVDIGDVILNDNTSSLYNVKLKKNNHYKNNIPIKIVFDDGYEIIAMIDVAFQLITQTWLSLRDYSIELQSGHAKIYLLRDNNTAPVGIDDVTGLRSSLQIIENNVNTKLKITDTTNRWQPKGNYLQPTDTTNKWSPKNHTHTLSQIQGLQDSLQLLRNMLNNGGGGNTNNTSKWTLVTGLTQDSKYSFLIPAPVAYKYELQIGTPVKCVLENHPTYLHITECPTYTNNSMTFYRIYSNFEGYYDNIYIGKKENYITIDFDLNGNVMEQQSMVNNILQQRGESYTWQKGPAVLYGISAKCGNIINWLPIMNPQATAGGMIVIVPKINNYQTGYFTSRVFENIWSSSDMYANLFGSYFINFNDVIDFDIFEADVSALTTLSDLHISMTFLLLDEDEIPTVQPNYMNISWELIDENTITDITDTNAPLFQKVSFGNTLENVDELHGLIKLVYDDDSEDIFRVNSVSDDNIILDAPTRKRKTGHVRIYRLGSRE